MAECAYLTTPSAIVHDGAIVMTLGCVIGSSQRVVSVRSLDHGATWEDAATVLVPGDVGCIVGAGVVSAAAVTPMLFHDPSGALHLSATNDVLGGCVTFPFDAASGAVGAPIRAIQTYRSGYLLVGCTFSAGGGGWLAGYDYPRRFLRAGVVF